MSLFTPIQAAVKDAKFEFQKWGDYNGCITVFKNRSSVFGKDFERYCQSLEVIGSFEMLHQQAKELLDKALDILVKEEIAAKKPRDVTPLDAASSSATASTSAVALTSLSSSASSSSSTSTAKFIEESSYILISNTETDNLLNLLGKAQTSAEVDALWSEIKKNKPNFSPEDLEEMISIFVNFDRPQYIAELMPS